MCIALGRLFTAGAALSKPEALVFQFLGGAAVLSFAQFWIVLCGLAYWQTFAITGAIAIAAGLRLRQSYRDLSTRIPRAYVAIFAAFGLFYFLQALKPEMSPDGATYHLGWVAQTFREHGFYARPQNFYWAFPKGLEMLYLFAFAFGRHSAAALVHFAFLLALAAALVLYAQRHNQLLAGIFASLLIFLSPAIALNGTTAYADVALAAAAFGTFCSLDLWKQTGSQRLLLLASTLAGFSFTIKYTGLLVIAYVVIAILIRKTSFYCATPAFLLAAPYLIRNWITVGNPVSPFLNVWFPNPNVHIAFESMIREMMRRYAGLGSYWQLPWETAVRGGILQGFLGPAFLLLPLSLFALRTSVGRTLLIAGALFALPVAGNVGTRFWIPSLPFFALALGLVVSKWPALTACIVAIHAVTVLPPISRQYAAPGAPMLGGEPPESYDVVRIIEKHVPANATVFALAWVMEAYTTPHIRTHHLSAANERLAETLWTPVTDGLQPGKRISFLFPKRSVASIRITQTAIVKPDPPRRLDSPGFILNKPRVQSDQWAINELRVFADGKEVSQSAEWLVHARPNPWDASLAFDKNPTTAWKTWEPTTPGMYFELDFGKPVEIDTVIFDSPNAQAAMRFELNGQQAQQSAAPVRPDLRRLATAALQRDGISFVLIDPTLSGAEDFKTNPEAWGMRFVDEASHGVRLYRLE